MGSTGAIKSSGSKLIDAVKYIRDRAYKFFKDKATGTHSYDDAKHKGEEQIDFFNQFSNYNELIDGMSSEERSAFRDWMNGWFMDGKQYRGFSKMDSVFQAMTRNYDNILDKATLDHDLITVRRTTAELIFGAGKTHATLDELNAMRGSFVTAKGNMSTGVASEGLTIGASGKDIEYVFHFPKGSKGCGMWIGDHRIGGWGAEQREFMTNRDSVYAVGKTTFDKSRRVYRVNMYYVGREQHDYS